MEKVNLRGHLFGQGTRVIVSKKDEKTLVFPLRLCSQGALRQNTGEEEREMKAKGRKQKRRKERREFLEGVGVPLVPDIVSHPKNVPTHT